MRKHNQKIQIDDVVSIIKKAGGACLEKLNPDVVIHSKDDPICPDKNIPYHDLLKNPNCVILKTKKKKDIDLLSDSPNIFNDNIRIKKNKIGQH